MYTTEKDMALESFFKIRVNFKRSSYELERKELGVGMHGVGNCYFFVNLEVLFEF